MKIYHTLLKSRFQFPTVYQIHLMVGELAGPNKSNNRCLYRYDHDGTKAQILMQTRNPVDLADLGPWQGSSQEIEIPDQERFGFRVRLSPMVFSKGRRIDLVGHLKRTKGLTWDESRCEAPNVWFDKRMNLLGFRVDECATEGYTWTKFQKPDGKMVEYPELDVAGILRVKDRDKFLSIIANGIGDERAFGCGMILLFKI